MSALFNRKVIWLLVVIVVLLLLFVSAWFSCPKYLNIMPGERIGEATFWEEIVEEINGSFELLKLLYVKNFCPGTAIVQ